jgi:hypothetical protein
MSRLPRTPIDQRAKRVSKIGDEADVQTEWQSEHRGECLGKPRRFLAFPLLSAKDVAGLENR